MIKKANIQHAAEIGQLFAAATAAMQARGLDQWNENYPLEAHARIDLESDCVYAYFVENKIAGVVTLNAQQEEQYKAIQWVDASENILVVHRLAVHPDYQHQGIAKSLMFFAKKLARAENYTSIRLDTYSQNEFSLAMYAKLGYEQKAGIVFFPGRRFHFYCFEKVL